MKKNNHTVIIISILILTLSLILIYGGQFLFSQIDKPAQSSPSTAGNSSSQPTLSQPLKYEHISAAINGYKQEIFLVEFDPADPRIDFGPVLSYDSIYGFEKISEICKRTGAIAAINAGFFFEYGDPVGMVAIDGDLKTKASGHAPVFILENQKAFFKKFYSQISFAHGNNKIIINEMNRMGKDDTIVLYSRYFGSTNRAKIKNTSVRVENNIVTEILKNSTQVNLKEGSYLISFYGKKSSTPEEMGIKVGDTLKLTISPRPEGKYQAYECGSMLVKDGLSVAPDKDMWVGTLNNRDPRTVIGIKKDGKVVLVVVDGRQPGYSTGFTGKELADYLISLGIADAAMLDGGATSQLYFDGSIRNKPSDRGIERPVAGAFVVKLAQ